MTMFKTSVLLFLLMIVNEGLSSVILIENFDDTSPGAFPHSWKATAKAGEKLYLVTEDKVTKNRYLSITDRGESVQVGKEITWSIRSYPKLSWRWRANRLPDGANEKDQRLDDSAAGVYVQFSNAWFVFPRAIKYVWSSTLPQGTVIKKGFTVIVVVESGPEMSGKWRSVSRDVYTDYLNYFNEEPMNPLGVALLTDANSTRSIASADYDDFVVSSRKLPQMLAFE